MHGPELREYSTSARLESQTRRTIRLRLSKFLIVQRGNNISDRILESNIRQRLKIIQPRGLLIKQRNRSLKKGGK
jgi:hypothetical protein